MNKLLKDLTPAEIQFVKDNEKATIKKTAELLDASPSAISAALGTKRSYHRAPSYTDIMNARKEGFTYKDIASLFDVSISTISRVVAQNKKSDPMEPSNPPLDPNFVRVSLTKFKGLMSEYSIQNNGNVSFRLQNCKDRITLYGDELQKLIRDLGAISNYITNFKGRSGK